MPSDLLAAAKVFQIPGPASSLQPGSVSSAQPGSASSARLGPEAVAIVPSGTGASSGRVPRSPTADSPRPVAAATACCSAGPHTRPWQ